MLDRVTVSAIVLLVLLPAAGAAGQTDDQIHRDVQRQVLADPHFTIFDSIRTEVEDGVVVLTGKVTLPHTRESVAARVRAVPGVREMRNGIDVLPVSPFDDSLRSHIARAIYGNAAFRAYASMPNPPIHIIVEDGRVTLEGVVRTEVDRMLAGSIARSSEALEVRNELRSGRGDTPRH